MASLLEQVKGFIEENIPHHIVTINLRFMSISFRDQEFARVINSADLTMTDGMPLVWLAKLLGTPIPERITGPDLIFNLSNLSAEKDYSIFLLGGDPGVAEEAGKRLCNLYPALRISGTHHGYFTADEEPKVVNFIKTCRPQLLFVGLGCPKQEFWIHRWMHELEVPVCAGIGGTLDCVIGRFNRAPLWMQQSSLEWVYRLKQEPRRLWRRYLLEDLPTALRIAGPAFRERFFNGVHR